MNIQYLRYAAIVAEYGSLRRAADELLIAPPNLSKAIRKLEDEIGIRIFNRSNNGMTLTDDGEDLMQNAWPILSQLDEVETYYKSRTISDPHFSVTVPRTAYITSAFSDFSKLEEIGGARLIYTESNAYTAIENVVNRQYGLGIIRAAIEYEQYYKPLLEKNGLDYCILSFFDQRAVINRKNPLSSLSEVTEDALSELTEITYIDEYVPAAIENKSSKISRSFSECNHIYVTRRLNSMELIRLNKEAYMWSAPMPKKFLDFFGLCQKKCSDNGRKYADVLIFRKNYKMTPLDKLFIECIHKIKEECGF